MRVIDCAPHTLTLTHTLNSGNSRKYQITFREISSFEFLTFSVIAWEKKVQVCDSATTGDGVISVEGHASENGNSPNPSGNKWKFVCDKEFNQISNNQKTYLNVSGVSKLSKVSWKNPIPVLFFPPPNSLNLVLVAHTHTYTFSYWITLSVFNYLKSLSKYCIFSNTYKFRCYTKLSDIS